MDKKYVVYRHIVPNGKMYVGLTRMNPIKRWNYGNGYKDCTLFFRAINKYGWDNIQHEILLDNLTKEQASLAERLFIGYWDLTNSDKGYNLEAGGFTGYDISDATRKKMSESAHKRKASDETKKKISITSTGRKHTEETKKLISKLYTGSGNPMYGKYGADNPTSKKVIAIDKNSDDVAYTFDSLHEASAYTNTNIANICYCCQGKRKSAGGYRWQYT